MLKNKKANFKINALLVLIRIKSYKSYHNKEKNAYNIKPTFLK